VIHHIYDRIESAPLQPVWIEIVPRQQALIRARALQESPRGPLYGIPFAIKDNIDVAGLPTTAGCPAYTYTPEATAFTVQKLLDAGAVLIGKTNLDQFATGLVGTRSPYGACSSVFDRHYVSGGSSSGSAVAVAGGLVSFSLGTDTAGSGRVPAAFNNLVGLKPSRGLLSASGVVPACRSLDCVSIFALDCADAEAVFLAARGFDAADPFGRAWPAVVPPTPAQLRCGVPPKSQWEFFGDQQAEKLFAETISTLREVNVEIVEFDLTPFQQTAELLYSGPYVAERFAAIGSFAKTHGDAMDPTVASIILGAENYTAAQAYEAQYKLAALSRKTKAYWQNMDVLVLPTAPTTYTIEEVQKDPIRLNANLGYYTNFVNLLDLSAVAVPAGFKQSGLPFGVTLIAPVFAEHSLLELASKIQTSRVDFVGARLAPLAELPKLKSPATSPGWVKVGVVGAHLSGQPLNYQLVEREAKLLQATRTAKDYKFFALTNTTPAKPGLIRVPGFAGPGIEIEVWLMPETAFGSFVAAIPPPLGIGSCELADGEVVKGFLCEPYAIENMPEITSYEGWRNYRSSKN
jgi:allophanate hydrolase